MTGGYESSSTLICSATTSSTVYKNKFGYVCALALRTQLHDTSEICAVQRVHVYFLQQWNLPPVLIRSCCVVMCVAHRACWCRAQAQRRCSLHILCILAPLLAFLCVEGLFLHFAAVTATADCMLHHWLLGSSMLSGGPRTGMLDTYVLIIICW
jgi:hypothetical protein